jgi:hypothetical protein
MGGERLNADPGVVGTTVQLRVYCEKLCILLGDYTVPDKRDTCGRARSNEWKKKFL